MMLPAQIIQKKRDGHALTEEEIRYFVDNFTLDGLPDYQMAALAMAVCFQGMNFDETMWLTRAMVESGKVVQWKPGAFYADKHSTGGIGDKVSLIEDIFFSWIRICASSSAASIRSGSVTK